MNVGFSAVITPVGRGLSELVRREFSPSVGHVAAVLGGCSFAPSLLTFWFVNGLLDFSTAYALGATNAPGGLVVRLVAYVLLVPTFVLLRAGYYLAHPTHRRTIISGSCPRREWLSLDWFSVGILATGLPLALRRLGPWLGFNATLAVGLFVLPRFVRGEREAPIRLASVLLGALVFVFASYGSLLTELAPWVPAPESVLGPVATLRLTDGTTSLLVRVFNSLLTGPLAVAAFALAMNYLLTRPELRSVPLLDRTLPRRDPPRIVLASATLGTVFYLLVVAGFTGWLVPVP